MQAYKIRIGGQTLLWAISHSPHTKSILIYSSVMKMVITVIIKSFHGTMVPFLVTTCNRNKQTKGNLFQQKGKLYTIKC